MEDTAKRPGGLTALAVINFVLAGFALLGILAFASDLPKSQIETEELKLNEQIKNDPNLVARDPKIAKQKENLEKRKIILNDPTVKILKFMDIVPTALLIISGVGYLKQKKILGRTMGNLCAATLIILEIAGILIVYDIINEAFSLLSLINFIYPALTLFLLNVTFKDDLVE